MKIHWNEITELGTDFVFTEEKAWLAAALARVDEQLEEQPAASTAPRPIEATLNLRMVDNVVVTRGRLKTSVRLLCSRCATPFFQPCETVFSGLYCRDPAMAGVGHLGETDRKPHGQIRGVSRPNHSDEDSEKDLDITYISNETIDLAEVLTEQLQLQVPFRPLCRDDCRGICAQCGADLNRGRCACAKLASGGPFSVLQDLPVRSTPGARAVSKKTSKKP